MAESGASLKLARLRRLEESEARRLAQRWEAVPLGTATRAGRTPARFGAVAGVSTNCWRPADSVFVEVARLVDGRIASADASVPEISCTTESPIASGLPACGLAIATEKEEPRGNWGSPMSAAKLSNCSANPLPSPVSGTHVGIGGAETETAVAEDAPTVTCGDEAHRPPHWATHLFNSIGQPTGVLES